METCLWALSALNDIPVVQTVHWSSEGHTIRGGRPGARGGDTVPGADASQQRDRRRRERTDARVRHGGGGVQQRGRGGRGAVHQGHGEVLRARGRAEQARHRRAHHAAPHLSPATAPCKALGVVAPLSTGIAVVIIEVDALPLLINPSLEVDQLRLNQITML